MESDFLLFPRGNTTLLRAISQLALHRYHTTQTLTSSCQGFIICLLYYRKKVTKMSMKITRIISIIMLLLEQEMISAPKLAEMFEVSPRTIYRDVDTMLMAGIPIVTFTGVTGGISIMPEYKIDKKLFTLSDITALLIGLGSIHSTLSNEELMATIVKIKGLVPTDQYKNIESTLNQITIDPTPWHGNQYLISYINLIKSAMSEKRLITFKYYDRLSKKSFRKIEPYRLALKNANWYIQGYCCDRNDYRIFSISRMESLKFTDDIFEPREFNYTSKDLEFRTGQNPTILKLRVHESLRSNILKYCNEESISETKNGKFLAYFSMVEDDYWYSILLQFGDKCECLEPLHVRQELKNRISKMLDLYS